MGEETVQNGKQHTQSIEVEIDGEKKRKENMVLQHFTFNSSTQN